MTKRVEKSKLVRDRIPEIISASGKKPVTKVLTPDAYLECLHEKLDEELQEYHETRSIDELVDLAEVMDAILAYRCVSRETFQVMQQEKRKERGAFEKRLFLMGVEDPSVDTGSGGGK